MRILRYRLLLLLPVLWSGCAHKQADPAEVAALRHTIEGLRAQNTSYAKQVEELENRVFILSDQMESRKVNEEKKALPQLPTVTLHAAPSPAVKVSQAQPPSDLFPDEPEVEYAGEAARTTTNRPVLRLHGESGQISIQHETSRPEPRTVEIMREGSAPKTPVSNEAVTAYRKAYEQLREEKHEEAAKAFRDFVRLFPNHDLSDNAQYWLGECFYARKEFTVAVREFRRVIERYPTGNKVPDALLKVGFSYLSLGSVEAGRQTLEQLQRSYPRHEAATLAAARLAELDRSPSRGATLETFPSARTAHVPKEVP